MAEPITTFFNALGLPEILLWLLTFAIVYGVLSQIQMPKHNATRAIIGMIAGFFVLMAVPGQLITVLSKMASSLLLVILGLLILIIFFEVSGHKTGKRVIELGPPDKEGKPTIKSEKAANILEAHPTVFALILIIIALLIFISSGGLELLGIQQISFGGISGNTLLFLLIIIAAIAWMIHESKG